MFNHSRIKTYYSVAGALEHDPSMFEFMDLDNRILSSGVITKNDLIDHITIECFELPLIYTDIDLMKLKIKLWAKKNKENWYRCYQALYEEYNPLHNYNRMEEITDNTSEEMTGTGENTTTFNSNVSDTRNISRDTDTDTTLTHNTTETTTHGHKVVFDEDIDNSKSDTVTDTTTHGHTVVTSEGTSGSETESGTETTIHSNTAYDAGLTATAKDELTKNLTKTNSQDTDGSEKHSGIDSVKSVGTHSDNTDIDKIETHSGNDTVKMTGTDKTAVEETETVSDSNMRRNTGTDKVDTEQETEMSRDYNHSAHLWGNIGVTTSQSMLTDEIEVRNKYNLMDIICDSFKREFCLAIY